MIRTRFAPAPTGYLHLGHVVSALHVWEFARANNGRVILRIEDHDSERSRRHYEAAILEDLAWLGFDADELVQRQSERHAIYGDVLAGLVRQGLVYGCACSRQEISAVVGSTDGREVRYPGTCRARGLGLGPRLGWRVRFDPGVEVFVDELMGPASQDPSEQCGDVLVRDRRGNWTYQWAVSVDDYLQDVTHVIRGRDLFASTGRQIKLARMVGRLSPARFRHHPLIMKTATEKLSKADRDTGVRDLRRAGWSAEEVIHEARRAVAAAGVG